MEQILGTLAVTPVRSVWTNEAFDFTPWLAQAPNIARLGEALGLELEVEHTEVAVGPYSADILAKEVGSGKYVVIENQLERTDHDHLGKAITYAAVLDAAIVVWVATDFTAEHQKALDWLNDHSTGSIGFYGVKLELWKIDGSRPALRFNVVSQPTEIVRQASITKATEDLTDAKKLQLEFWSAFRESLLSRRIVPSAQSARPQYWYEISLGRSGIHLSAIANTYEGKIGVRVYFANQVADQALAQLELEREVIESELGFALAWNPNPQNRDKILLVVREADLSNRAQWPEYLDWLIDRTSRLRTAFAPRIKRLDLKRTIELPGA
jgi:hypothetical protein